MADLALIFEPGVNMVFLRRRLSPCIERYATVLAGGQSFASQLVTPARAPAVDSLLPVSPDFRQKLFKQDIEALVELYADLTEATELGLRFRNLENAMCPRFHTDKVGIRLICAYVGPGTEWLSDEDADRTALGGRVVVGGEPDPVLCKAGVVRHVPTGAIALLKGEAWPGNEARGVVHRSPPASKDAPRLLLTIDQVAG